MSKLIKAYKACPSPSNRTKLQSYINKHVMAICLASEDEVAFLKAHEFNV